MTLSIIGRCPSSTLMGAAMVSGDPFVGAYGMHFASGHVCVVQAQSGPAQAQLLLREISCGLPIQAAIQMITARSEAERWQIGCLGAQGDGGAVTGKRVFLIAGCSLGAEHVVLGNTLSAEVVLEATGFAFVSAVGSLASRLIAGLSAGVSVGGDKRGHRAARLLVFTYSGQIVNDVRIDDHEDPITELERLLHLQQQRAQFGPLLEEALPVINRVAGTVDKGTPLEIVMPLLLKAALPSERDAIQRFIRVTSHAQPLRGITVYELLAFLS